MTVKELIQNKDYDYMEWRATLPAEDGGGDTFIGSTKSENGVLLPLDHDDYDEETEILSYEEWSNPSQSVVNGVTIVYEGKWITLQDLKESEE